MPFVLYWASPGIELKLKQPYYKSWSADLVLWFGAKETLIWRHFVVPWHWQQACREDESSMTFVPFFKKINQLNNCILCG